MTHLKDEQIKQLMGPIDPAMISKRKKGSIELSYVDGSYVIGRLCEILGPTGWSFSLDTLQKVEEDKNTKGLHVVGYTCIGTVTLPDGTAKQDVGFGQGIDRSLGGAHESAVKEAATDCLKRCARMLGWHMGLALYDKSGTHVHVDSDTLISKKKLTASDKADILSLKGKIDDDVYQSLVDRYKKEVK